MIDIQDLTVDCKRGVLNKMVIIAQMLIFRTLLRLNFQGKISKSRSWVNDEFIFRNALKDYVC